MTIDRMLSLLAILMLVFGGLLAVIGGALYSGARSDAVDADDQDELDDALEDEGTAMFVLGAGIFLGFLGLSLHMLGEKFLMNFELITQAPPRSQDHKHPSNYPFDERK